MLDFFSDLTMTKNYEEAPGLDKTSLNKSELCGYKR